MGRPWIAKVLRWAAWFFAFAPFATVVIVGRLFGVARPDNWPTIASSLLVGALGTGFLSLVFAAPRRGRTATVRAQNNALEVEYNPGEIQKISFEEIRGAAAPVDPTSPGLALDLSGGRSMMIRTGSIELAQSLREAIHPMGATGRYRMPLSTSGRSAVMGVVSLVASIFVSVAVSNSTNVGVITAMRGVLWFIAIATILGVSSLITYRPDVEVGADGVLIDSVFGKRFLAYRDLKSIRAEEGFLFIERLNGKQARFKVRLANKERFASLNDCIERAFQVANSANESGRTAALDRMGRSVKEWREYISQLATHRVAYRGQTLTPEEAEAVLAAGDATPEHRIGAALVLKAGDPERAREQIAIASKGCANPKLRIALSELSEGDLDDDAMAEAMAEEESSATAGDPKNQRRLG